jgi:GDPmannose 4,6-dehydratase
MSDFDLVKSIIRKTNPDEIYNFASQMYAPASWEDPEAVVRVNGLVVAAILEAVRSAKSPARFFQAGSADIFGHPADVCSELTPSRPRNPYGIAKAIAGDLVRVYREHYDLFACTGIFFNMESSRRSEFFFARKVVIEVARMRREHDAGTIPQPIVFKGGLDAIRDWGLVPEYVEASWKMLDADQPDDYVIATGASYTCREFVVQALLEAGFPDACERFGDYVCSGTGAGDVMRADPSKIRCNLGWRASTRGTDVVHALVREELERWRGQSPAV